MRKSYLNLEVFNKRNGTKGTVIGQDDDTISIRTGDAVKAVTESTFRRWYTIVSAPSDQEQDEGKKVSEEKEKFGEKEDKKNFPVGASGIGNELREKFLSLVKEQANQNLDITYDEKNHRDTIKYNGRNVFECTTAKRRFNVMCHPNSLTPDNLKRANRIFPKEWGWSLRAKFVFTDTNQWPLMKTIIVDGLFYRQIEE